jgi:hypothetical protein
MIIDVNAQRARLSLGLLALCAVIGLSAGALLGSVWHSFQRAMYHHGQFVWGPAGIVAHNMWVFALVGMCLGSVTYVLVWRFSHALDVLFLSELASLSVTAVIVWITHLEILLPVGAAIGLLVPVLRQLRPQGAGQR